MIDKVYTALGGRKFIGMILLGGGAIAVDLTTDRGLTMALAGFLGTLYTIFAATNVANKKVVGQGGVDSQPKESPQDHLAEFRAELANMQEGILQAAEISAQTQNIIVQAMQLPQQNTPQQGDR